MGNELDTQRRLASDIFGVGKARVWLDPAKGKQIKEAITRSDILGLIDKGSIKKKELQGQSRWHARTLRKKKNSRGKNIGSRKGKKHARMQFEWKDRVRPLRNELQKLRAAGKIENKEFRVLYTKIKGNEFHNVNHMRNAITEMTKGKI